MTTGKHGAIDKSEKRMASETYCGNQNSKKPRVEEHMKSAKRKYRIKSIKIPIKLKKKIKVEKKRSTMFQLSGIACIKGMFECNRKRERENHQKI